MPVSLLFGLLAAVPAASCPPTPSQDENPGRRGQGAGLPNLVALPDDYVQLCRLPEGGTQPRLRRDAAGQAVVLYFRDGDLFLTRSEDEAKTFGPSTRINATPGAVPTVAGFHLAAFGLGPDGRAHVVWTSADELPRLSYARENVDGSFVTQDLQTAPGMCRGAAVTADAEGSVYVFYGALDPAAEPDPETGNGVRVWLRRSTPDGVFGTPIPAGKPRGVSTECPMDAVFDPWSKTVYSFYRTAYSPRGNEKILSRDLRLLSTEDGGESWVDKLTDNWRYKRSLTAMARLDLDPIPQSVRATWEGRGTPYAAIVRRNYNTVALALETRDGKGMWRASTASASGERGDLLMVWVERPVDEPDAPAVLGWKVFDRESRAPLGGGRSPESCGDSVPAVLARSGGGYNVLY